ncbi:MAG: glycosyltransferase family 9 protein, partial [bacterium]|nr:glycosyltransferase family 9 protein [bacterium]
AGGPMKKILVIQTAFLGDVILSTPFFRALADVFPGAAVDAVTIPSTKIVFRDSPAVRRVWTLDKSTPLRKAAGLFRLVRGLRAEQYDMAFSLQLHATSSFLMAASGIRTRVGFRRQRGLTHPVTPPRGLHMRRRYLTLLAPFTDRSFDDRTELRWSVAEDSAAEAVIAPLRRAGGALVGLAPGSVWPTKRWPESHYAALARILSAGGMNLVAVGGREDRGLCASVLDGTGSRSLNCAGELSVLESAAVLSRLDALVTNDSAPLHMADAVRTDVIAIFGPTVRRFGCAPWRPGDEILERDLPCRPCSRHGGRRCPEGHFRCMLDTKPEAVAERVRLHTGSSRPSSTAKGFPG